MKSFCSALSHRFFGVQMAEMFGVNKHCCDKFTGPDTKNKQLRVRCCAHSFVTSVVMRVLTCLIPGLLFFTSCKEEDPMTADEMALNDGITRILFIGNSLTFYNDLPEMVRGIARSNDERDSVYVFNSWGGYSLKMHITEDLTLGAINRQEWDWVVLQESTPYMAFQEFQGASVLPYARRLDSLIHLRNSATRVLLYLANGFEDGIGDCENYPEVCSHDLMVNAMRSNYTLLALELNAAIAPAAVLWKMLRPQTKISLHDPDRAHPSLAESYLSALTIYASIFRDELSEHVFAPSEVDDALKMLMIREVNASVIHESPDWKTY